MTRNEQNNFIRRFSKIAPNFYWRLTKYGRLRGHTWGDTSCSHGFCPLTAMYYSKTGKRISVYKVFDNFDLAVKTNVTKIDENYNLKNIVEIVDSADDYTDHYNFNLGLRNKLLKTVGLYE